METNSTGAIFIRNHGIATLSFLFAGIQLVSKLAMYMIGVAVIFILISTGQGEELLRISSESQKTLAEVLVFSLIPALYSLLTYSSAVLFLRVVPATSWMPICGREVKVTHLYVWALLLSLPIPSLFLLKFDWPLARVLAAILLLTLLVLAYRSSTSHWEKIDPGSSSTEKSTRPVRTLPTGFYALILVIVLPMLIVGCVFTATNPDLARYLGTIGVLTLAISMWATLATVILGLAPSYLGTPCLYLLLVLTLPFARTSTTSMYIKDARVPNIASDLSNDPRPTVTAHFEKWLAKFEEYPSDRPIPIFLVVAEGGGIRAASWTSSVLQAMDTETKGKFSQHVFAYSGVSGGSVGMGFHVAGLSEKTQFRADLCGDPCALSDDFLSPLVARIAILDPMRLIPFVEERTLARDAYFEKTLEHSFSAWNGETSLADSFVTNSGLSDVPNRSIVIFNTTDASTGNRVHFSNALIKSGTDGFKALGFKYLDSPTSFFLHLSARFPLVSPPAVLRASGANSGDDVVSQPNSSLILVDGGYRENTGAEEILAVAGELVSYRKEAFSDEIEPEGATLLNDHSSEEEYSDAEESNDMEIGRALEKLQPRFDAKERQKRLRHILARVQFHIIAITNNDYARAIDPTGDRILTIPAISIPLEAILSGRLATTRKSVGDLQRLPEPINTSSFNRCVLLRSSSQDFTRLGEKGTIEWNIILDGFEVLLSECQSEATQDTYTEFALLQDDGGAAPPLGWHLSPKTHERIRYKAAFYAKNRRVKNQFESSSWWEAVHEFQCSASSDATLEVDADGAYQCVFDSTRAN